ncbi:hypothetical protein H2201_006683 [Coniosporium apollinis]|uniref:Uncharacterized protein n=1 Tax=Coniosporium apollinis TaxID=61459 RepID=A0ABQ9NPK2_9PEZI|nr:hypothetical protein H2201_006683 [Coniosporium apollinis]
MATEVSSTRLYLGSFLSEGEDQASDWLRGPAGQEDLLSHGGEETPCDATAPQTCQVGDLGGKHGNITSGSFHAAYTDLYASLVPGVGSFFGNRSVVVHFANTMRKRYSRPLLFTAASFFLSSVHRLPTSPRN